MWKVNDFHSHIHQKALVFLTDNSNSLIHQRKKHVRKTHHCRKFSFAEEF